MESPIVGTFMIRFSKTGLVADTKALLVVLGTVDGRKRTAHLRASAKTALCDAILFAILLSLY